MSEPYTIQGHRPTEEEQQRAIQETGMQVWLHAKTQEDKRKQEEEKTQQELLRLEQRHIEVTMLRQCLDSGIPPSVVPMVFSALRGMKTNFAQKDAQSLEWPRDSPPPESNSDSRMNPFQGAAQQRPWHHRYHTSPNFQPPPNNAVLPHPRPPEPIAHTSPVQPPSISYSRLPQISSRGSASKRQSQYTTIHDHSPPIDHPQTNIQPPNVNGLPPSQQPGSPAYPIQAQATPINYPTARNDCVREATQQQPGQHTLPTVQSRPNDHSRPHDRSRPNDQRWPNVTGIAPAPQSRSPEPRISSTQEQPATKRPFVFNFYNPPVNTAPVTRPLAFNFYTPPYKPPPFKPNAESSRQETSEPPSKKIRHSQREASDSGRIEALSVPDGSNVDDRPKAPSLGPSKNSRSQEPPRLQEFRTWIDVSPKLQYYRKRTRST